MKVSDMSPQKALRASVILDSRFPGELDIIRLLKAVPVNGERTAFLRTLVLIGFAEWCKENEPIAQDRGGEPNE